MPTDNTSSTNSQGTQGQGTQGQGTLATQGDKGQSRQTQSNTRQSATTQQGNGQGQDQGQGADKYRTGDSLAAGDHGSGDRGGAPEGDYQINVPEGYEIPSETMKEIDTIFRRNHISNDGAQELVDFYDRQTKEAMEAPYELWADTQQKWVDEMKSDRELGGANLNRTLSVVSRFINAMPNAKEFKEALNYTGAGNHPAIIRGLYAMGKARVENQTHVRGDTSVNTGRPKGPGARSLYPDLPSVSGA